jgi:hypothetical protein
VNLSHYSRRLISLISKTLRERDTSDIIPAKMDVLLSLPIASYFLAPAMTSWSTSLNLLFFYMTWSTLILSHPPLKIELMGVLALRLVLWLAPSLLFLLFDILLPSLAESIKLGGYSALPPRDPAFLAKTLVLSILNLALGVALEGGISLGFSAAFKAPIFKTSTTLPLPWGMIKQIVFLVAAREVLTYYVHFKLLHGKNQLAKLHAQYAHARRSAPFSLLLFADHPLPFFLQRILPIYLPALILRPHLLTYFLFVALATAEETLAMSGYSIVPGIIMGGIARRTAIHYASGGSGNYAAWGVLDWFHGTSKGKDVIEDVKDEADKHRLKERSARAADDGASMLQQGIDSVRKSRRSKRGKKNADSDF